LEPSYDYIPPEKESNPSLLEIIRSIYEDDELTPVLPYDPDALLSKRTRDAFEAPSPRAHKIAKICSLWSFSANPTPAEIDSKIQECIWTATLLTCGTGKPGRKPRLDFFLMHLLNSSIFLHSLVKIIPNPEHQVRLLRYWIVSMVGIIILRGRPRIDGDLIMSYTDIPKPPSYANVFPQAHADALAPEYINPWPLIIQSVLHARDSHTVKAIRALLYASKKYGLTPPGGVPGALDSSGEETLKGLKHVDGSIFIRGAGLVLDQLGWVDWGQPAGEWDRSALGWNDAWRDGK